jgi:hypothetical protein
MEMKKIGIGLIVLILLTVVALPVLAKPNQGNNGTTLAGYKTLDICTVDENTWRYSGEIAVWNEGAIDTVGFTINDIIETKNLQGPKWTPLVTVFEDYMPEEIPAGTTQETALTFPYSVNADPWTVSNIRNNASLTILNHSNYIGTPFGPNPKVTYDGSMPPPACEQEMGCTYTQGYWGNKPGVVWPSSYSRDTTFFLSGQTWQQVMDTPVNVSQGYYQLAHQYIAAVLNQANDAYVPQGVQDTLDLAYAWLSANGPSACPSGGSCGTQKDWAAVLASYNEGLYPGGPGHCGDE